MLKTTQTLMKGQVYSITGESASKECWKILIDENKRIFIPKNQMGETFKFVDTLDLEHVNKNTESQEDFDNSKGYKKIQMLIPMGSLTEGRVYRIEGESNTKLSWKVLNNDDNYSMVKKSLEGQYFKCSISENGIRNVENLVKDELPERLPQKSEIKSDNSADVPNGLSQFNASGHENNVDAISVERQDKMPSSSIDRIGSLNPSPKQPTVCMFTLVTTVSQAKVEVQRILYACSEKSLLVIDCEGVNLSAEGELTLIQVAFHFDGRVQCAVFDL